MAVAPLEAVQNIADGSVTTNANFGKPLYDVAKSILGAAAGNPDANGGAPALPRSPLWGFLSFTNAPGITSYPGSSPASVYSTGSAQSVTVPVGQMLLVEALNTNLSTANGAAVTINDGTNTTTVAQLIASGMWFSQWPILCDQGWIFTSPQNSGWRGFYVLRDTQVTPIARQVPNSGASRYTVPNGFTLWLMGCVGIGANGIWLTDSGGVPICPAPDAQGTTYNTGAGLGNGVPGPPIPIAAGTILQSSDASHAASFWGVLL